MKANELEVGELYRFIQFADKEFEFELATPFGLTHFCMANGRKIISAGYISVYEKHIRMDDPWSISLGIGCAEQTYKDLEKTLGKQVKDKFEWVQNTYRGIYKGLAMNNLRWFNANVG